MPNVSWNDYTYFEALGSIPVINNTNASAIIQVICTLRLFTNACLSPWQTLNR